MASYAQPDYIYGFYFWLDIISTLSLLLDIMWISDAIFQTGGGAGGGQSAASIAKAARASRIGTRAARVIRIIRLIRLIRIIKLYKQAEKAEEDRREAKNAHSDGQRGSNYHEGDEGIHREHSEGDVNRRNSSKDLLGKKSGHGMDGDDMTSQGMGVTIVDGKVMSADANMEDLLHETNVGKKLGAKTNKIVIILILSIMMTIPLFGADTYSQEDTEYEGALLGLSFHSASVQITQTAGTDIYSAVTHPVFDAAWNKVIEKFTNQRINLVRMQFMQNVNDKLTSLKIDYGNEDHTEYLRTLEMTTVSVEYESIEFPNYKMTLIAFWDARPDAILGGILGLLRTIFVCILLASASMQMNKDAEDLVITPIETMISKVKRISKNPLEAAQIEEQDALAWEELAQKDKKIIQLTKEKAKFETAMLESIIVKIGALLALGFGEAGSEIIAENMSKSNFYPLKTKKVVGSSPCCLEKRCSLCLVFAISEILLTLQKFCKSMS